MRKISILVADDHQILRDLLVNLLKSKENLEVISEAADGYQALQEALRLQPDLVILDISLPKLNGIEVAKQLKNQAPAIKTIILTMHKSEDFVRSAYQAGVRAYLLKENALEELLHAIEVVINGGIHISDQIAPLIISGLLENPSAGQGEEMITTREREVMQLLAEGYSNKEIAGILTISLKTVETHRANIMKKLNFRSITDLVLYAVRHHIIEP